jgi:hypothetical protein
MYGEGSGRGRAHLAPAGDHLTIAFQFLGVFIVATSAAAVLTSRIFIIELIAGRAGTTPRRVGGRATIGFTHIATAITLALLSPLLSLTAILVRWCSLHPLGVVFPGAIPVRRLTFRFRIVVLAAGAAGVEISHGRILRHCVVAQLIGERAYG